MRKHGKGGPAPGPAPHTHSQRPLETFDELSTSSPSSRTSAEAVPLPTARPRDSIAWASAGVPKATSCRKACAACVGLRVSLGACEYASMREVRQRSSGCMRS